MTGQDDFLCGMTGYMDNSMGKLGRIYCKIEVDTEIFNQVGHFHSQGIDLLCCQACRNVDVLSVLVCPCWSLFVRACNTCINDYDTTYLLLILC